MRRNHSQTKRSILFAGILAIAAGLTAQAPNVELVDPSAQVEVAKTPAPIPDSAKVLSIDGVDYTMTELRTAVTFRQDTTKPINTERDLPLLRGEGLLSVGRTIGAFNRLTAQSREAGIELGPSQIEERDGYLDRFAGSVLYREQVLDKAQPISEEEIRARFEEVKASRFVQDEELRLRQIFISTYKEYTVKDGDTLESIALAESGDESLADRILANDTKKPRAESLTAVDGSDSTLPPRGLVAGEVLMVPMNDAEAQAVAARFETILAEINEETGFVAVAQKYSENQRPGEQWIIRPKKQDRPVLKELTDAFFALEDGKISAPVRTKHGYHVILRETHVPEGFKPFEEVRELLETELVAEQRRKLTTEFFTNVVIKENNLVALHEANIVKSAADESPDDIIATIGTREFKRGEYNQATRDALKDDANRNVAAVSSIMATTSLYQAAMLNAYRSLPSFMERADTQAQIASLEQAQLAQLMIDKLTKDSVPQTSEEEARKFYDENPKNFLVPESFDLAMIQLKEPEGSEPGALEFMKTELEERLRNVTSLEDFRQYANDVRLSPGGQGTSPEGQVQGRPASSYSKAQLDAIRGVDFPGLSTILEDASAGTLTVYWVSNITPESTRPFDEVKQQLADQLTQEARNVFQNKTMEDMRQAVDVKILFEE